VLVTVLARRARRGHPVRVSSGATGGVVTRYVAVGDADVAYQVIGDGDVDILYFIGLGRHVELMSVVTLCTG
jgi:hypothetical protein